MTKVDELVFSYRTRATDYRKQSIMIKRKDLSLKPAEQLELAEKLDCMVYSNDDDTIIIDFTNHYKTFEKQIKHQYWSLMALFFLLPLILLMFISFAKSTTALLGLFAIIIALMVLVAVIAVLLGLTTQRMFRFISWWGYTDWK